MREFDYARRAIQLNSVDYLLKPIDFEKLKEAVQRAAESVAKEKKIQDLRQESIKWNRNRKNSAAGYLEKCAERRLL